MGNCPVRQAPVAGRLAPAGARYWLALIVRLVVVPHLLQV